MASLDSLGRSARLILGYGVAAVSVAAAVIGLMLMAAHWQSAAHASLALIAVITGTSLGVAACVVWITATERRSSDALRIENAESRRAQEALRISEAKFRALSQSAPSAMFIFQAARIVYANPAASVITGYSCAELVGMNALDLVHPDFRGLIALALQPAAPDEAHAWRDDVKIVTKSGEERWVESVKRRFELEGQPAVVCIASDITERKRVAEAANESQQLLNLVLETLPAGVAVTDRAGDLILHNAASRRIWAETMIHSGAERWVRSAGYRHDSGEKVAPAEWPSVRALRDGKITLNELIDIDAFDGRRKTIQASAAPIRSAEGQIVGAVIVMDEVTDRVRAQTALRESAERLQHLSRRLLKVQEEERRHLSRELHDEFGQLLASVTLHLHAAKGVAGPAAQANLDESTVLLQRAGAQVRSLALELRPTMLETGGLESALRWLARQHQQRTAIVTEVVGHVTDVSGELAVACFRVAQEALTNVVRHARAQHVWIELHQHEGSFELVVRDDGVGFDVTRTIERAASGGNLGLLGMRERVEILGGSLEIDSQSGRGTRIGISLPLGEPISMVAQHTAA